MSQSSIHPDRLLELLADRATQGLPPHERDELEKLLRAAPDVDAWSMDEAAAAADLSMQEPVEPMPAALQKMVEADAVAWLAQRRGFVVAPAGESAPPPPPAPATATAGAAFGAKAWLPWLAAAAGIVLAVIAWWPSPSPGPGDLSRDLQALLADPNTREYAWSDAAGTGASGTVVWNNARQEGFLRLSNLAANDPRFIQYQLWIFDAQRNEPFNAVDGGVFDVTDPAGAVVRIDPKLKVFDPALFAITSEAPGGVVKHDPALDPEKYKILLTAPVES